MVPDKSTSLKSAPFNIVFVKWLSFNLLPLKELFFMLRSEKLQYCSRLFLKFAEKNVFSHLKNSVPAILQSENWASCSRQPSSFTRLKLQFEKVHEQNFAFRRTASEKSQLLKAQPVKDCFSKLFLEKLSDLIVCPSIFCDSGMVIANSSLGGTSLNFSRSLPAQIQFHSQVSDKKAV